MNILSKIFQLTHRVLSTLLSALFLIWFLSGLVMLYQTFPKIDKTDRIARMEIISGELPPISSIEARVPKGEIIRSITLNNPFGQTIFHVKTDKSDLFLPADSLASLPRIDFPLIETVAQRWNDAPIKRIDTLRELDQFIPYDRYESDFPIYKFHFSDKANTQLYVSGTDGEPIQITTFTQRVWAWLGPIPHWIYLTQLRRDATRWADTVIWLSGIGCVMVIAGIYMGIRSFKIARQRKRNPTTTPYKRKWFKWHHVTGLLFGLFVLTFTFSGMMSLAPIPKWLTAPQLSFNGSRVLFSQVPTIDQYRLDYRTVLAAYSGKVRQLEWSNLYDRPFYTVRIGHETNIIDASDTIIHPFEIDREMISNIIHQIYGSETSISIDRIDEYDTYYTSRKHKLPLPVWKVAVQDTDNSLYYIHAPTATYTYVNNTSRWRHWMYPTWHSYNIAWLVKHPVWWNILMWTTMLGGTVVALTGIVLGIRYLRRIVGRHLRKPQYDS